MANLVGAIAGGIAGAGIGVANALARPYYPPGGPWVQYPGIDWYQGDDGHWYPYRSGALVASIPAFGWREGRGWRPRDWGRHRRPRFGGQRWRQGLADGGRAGFPASRVFLSSGCAARGTDSTLGCAAAYSDHDAARAGGEGPRAAQHHLSSGAHYVDGGPIVSEYPDVIPLEDVVDGLADLLAGVRPEAIVPGGIRIVSMQVDDQEMDTLRDAALLAQGIYARIPAGAVFGRNDVLQDHEGKYYDHVVTAGAFATSTLRINCELYDA